MYLRFLFVLMFVLSTVVSAKEVVIPRTSHYDARDNFYPVELLQFVLKKAGYDFTLKVSEDIYSQSRIVERIKTNKLDVFWMGTSASYEEELHAIPYPIYRGLTGYRIFIIHRDNQVDFNEVNYLEDLQSFKGLQGVGWSDIEILEFSGLKQDQALYDNLFEMINLGRGDYFSRSLPEIFFELDYRQTWLKNLTAEKKLLLVYPFALFFFTNKDNTELSSAIEQGFQLADEDGSFLSFFYQHPDIISAIERANIDQRHRIEIPNPALTQKTRNIPKRYWHE